ncbi:MAG: TonB-dependent receptor [Sedimentisphaerales bacterium]|nr:TonB-dependent receptor [Sedimentisphaerales bacterium]
MPVKIPYHTHTEPINSDHRRLWAFWAVWWSIVLLIPSPIWAQDKHAQAGPDNSAIEEREPEKAKAEGGSDPSELMKMDLEELMDVEITVASKKAEKLYEAPGIGVVVPRDEMDVYGDRSLHQLLQRQPSIYTRGSYMYPNNMAAVRGDMPTHLDLHNLILFNGRPIRESGFGGVNFPVYMTFPLSSLESVEIIRGPGSVLYGTNAFSGVINLKPREAPQRNEFSISSQAGSHGYYETDVAGGGTFGDLGFFSAVRTSGQHGYTYRLTDGMGTYDTDRDGNKSVSAATHLNYKGFTFDFFATSMETFHVGALPFWSVPGHVFRVNKLFANAGYRADVHERVQLELNVTYNLHENDFAGFPTGDVSSNASDILGEGTLYVNPLDNLNLVLGYLHEYQMNCEGNGYESIPLYRHKPQSAYIQGDYQLGKILKLIAGGQWNRTGQGLSDFISRYGVIITPAPKWGVKLLRAEAFRAPFAIETDLYDLPILVGNQGLEPESITTYDAQLFYNDDTTYAAVTYFKSMIDQLIVRDTSVNPASFMNGGKQTFDGIELEAKHFLTPNWHVLGSFLHQESEEDDDINPSTVPNNMLKAGTGYAWDWGSVGLFYAFYGNPPHLATENVVNPEPDELHLASLNVRIDPSQWLGCEKDRVLLTFKVENIFNEKIHVPEFNRGGQPNSLPDGPGITVYGGLTIRF